MRPGIAALCHLGNSSSSSSQDNDIGVTDDGVALGQGAAGGTDSVNAATASGFLNTAQSVRDQATLISGSSVKGDDFTNAKIQDGGVSLGGANSGTINVTNSAAGAEKIAETFAATVRDLATNRPQSQQQGVPLATETTEAAATTTTDSKTNLLKWFGGVVAFLVVGEILRRIFFSTKKS